MTKPKSKTRAANRLTTRKISKPKSRIRSASRSPNTGGRADTKHARVLSMLRASGGTTIASIMTATDWQPHSVRGFLAGIVRKKLGLNLVSEQTDKGRIYRIKEGRSSATAADRAKQVA